MAAARAPAPPPGGAATAPAPAPPRLRARAAGRKVATALLALALFVLAIELLKAGARGLASLAGPWIEFGDPVNALGFGWVLATLVLSGSPIAAMALALFAGGVLGPVGAYAMIAGSRLGAAFIVLLLGFLYAAHPRHRHRAAVGLYPGVLSLLVTYTIAAPGLLLGLALLASGALAPYAPGTPPAVLGLLEASFGRAAERLAALAPHALLVFAAGLAVVLAAFKLFDAALPDVRRRAGRLGAMAERIYRPSVLFAFGFAVTVLTLSVSVSLSLLVPLTVRGVVRRENLIPYTMGANVSTFIDTLAAGAVVGGAEAFEVVLAVMLGVAAVSLAVIATAYTWYEEALYRSTGWLLASRRRLAAFLTVVLICPLALSLL